MNTVRQLTSSLWMCTHRFTVKIITRSPLIHYLFCWNEWSLWQKFFSPVEVIESQTFSPKILIMSSYVGKSQLSSKILMEELYWFIVFNMIRFNENLYIYIYFWDLFLEWNYPNNYFFINIPLIWESWPAWQNNKDSSNGVNLGQRHGFDIQWKVSRELGKPVWKQ